MIRQKFAPLLLTILAGCVNNQAVVDTWAGKSLDSLVVKWGVPTAQQDLSDGRKASTYNRARIYEGTSYSCRITFVSRDGIVESGTVVGRC